MKSLSERLSESLNEEKVTFQKYNDSVNEKRITNKFDPDFKPTEKETAIKADTGVWYLRKMGDSTHFHMSNDSENIKLSMAQHIGQSETEPYYKDIKDWLVGRITSKELFKTDYTGMGSGVNDIYR